MTSKTFKYGILKIGLFSCVNTIIFIRSSCLHIRPISRGFLIIGVEYLGGGGGGALRGSSPLDIFQGGLSPCRNFVELNCCNYTS